MTNRSRCRVGHSFRVVELQSGRLTLVCRRCGFETPVPDVPSDGGDAA